MALFKVKRIDIFGDYEYEHYVIIAKDKEDALNIVRRKDRLFTKYNTSISKVNLLNPLVLILFILI